MHEAGKREIRTSSLNGVNAVVGVGGAHGTAILAGGGISESWKIANDFAFEDEGTAGEDISVAES